MEDLKNTLEGFKEILKQNLEAKTPSHSAVMLWLIKVFAIANSHLQKATTLVEKGEVFTLMKTLHPFLEANKEVIEQKLKDEDIRKPEEIMMTMISFEKQKTIYAKFLRAANREKGRKNRNKFKKKGL